MAVVDIPRPRICTIRLLQIASHCIKTGRVGHRLKAVCIYVQYWFLPFPYTCRARWPIMAKWGLTSIFIFCIYQPLESTFSYLSSGIKCFPVRWPSQQMQPPPQKKKWFWHTVLTILWLKALFTQKGLLECNPHLATPGHILSPVVTACWENTKGAPIGFVCTFQARATELIKRGLMPVI